MESLALESVDNVQIVESLGSRWSVAKEKEGLETLVTGVEKTTGRK